MKLTNREAWRIVTKTISSWRNDYAPSMGAALAFYAMFSIAPLLLIVVAVGGYFFGAGAMRGEIDSLLSGLLGENSARTIEKLVEGANAPSRRLVATAIGVVVFLVGATSVFNELQDSLNRIWKAHLRPRRSGFLSFLRARLISLGMIVGISLLIMLSFVVSVAFSTFGRSWGAINVEWEFFAQVLSSVVSFVLMTATFALIYKVIPQVRVLWKDVWIGAATTSVLFTLGKKLIGIYLGRNGVESAFGALSSLAVFLLWVYYSAQIFLLGAEFTWIHSNDRANRRSASQRRSADAALLVAKEDAPLPSREGTRADRRESGDR